MSSYYPDKFVIIKIVTPTYGTLYKVLASWYGGYVGSDSWKLSSGITKVTLNEGIYEFLNHSGSTYFGTKENYGMSMYTAGIYADLVAQVKEMTGENSVEIVDKEAIDSLELED